MVFIYPCITSENVNREIVPAASKTMELFFLYQLQSAFNDGTITCSQKYDYGRNVPGAITFESVQTDSKNNKLVLENSFDALNNIKMIIKEGKIIYVNNYKKPRVSCNDNINEIIKESQNIEEKLHVFRIQLNSFIEESANLEVKESAKKILKSVTEDIKKEHSFRTILEATPPQPSNSSSTGTPSNVNITLKQDKKESTKKSDSYKKSDDYRVDLTPTSMPIEADIKVEDSNGHEKWTRKYITVGVKVIPIKIKNFDKVNDALLDDYFSKVSESIFKTIYRNTLRTVYSKFKNVLKSFGLSKLVSIVSDEPGHEDKKDIVRDMITLAPSDFVNASAFRNNPDAPDNYNFTSSVVMFNKDDIEEDESIFSNRSAMNRLFRMGWTSFAVLDPVKEVMLFISNLDGGFLHELPYSYMFNSLNAADIYKNESALRNGTRPFSIRKGNFSTFARSVRD